MKHTVTTLLLLMLAALTARAGGMLGVPGQARTYIYPTSTAVTATIQDQVAMTVVRQAFTNRTGRAAKVQYLFPTGLRSAVSGFRWWAGGVEHSAAIAGKPQDTSIFSGGGGGAGSDLLLEAYLGPSPFIFPFQQELAADSTLVVELTYFELLPYRTGAVSFTCPLAFNGFAAPRQKLSISVAVETRKNLASIASQAFPELTFKTGARTATGAITIDGFLPNRNLDITYGVDQASLGVTLLSTKPDTGSGYFIMLAEPAPAASQQEVIDKTFTFVIDVSGSMVGTKIAQARRAAIYTIEHLNPDDRFNVVRFSDEPSKLFTDPVPATQANVQAATAYVSALTANGGTNLEGALLAALGQSAADSTSNVIIFLTDGLAKLDQQRVRLANTSNTRIFVFGVGADVDTSLLRQVAALNNGSAEFLGTDNVDSRIADFYNHIRNPLLQNVAVSFSAGGVHEVYPLQLPDLYVGEQLVMVGRYRTPGDAVATLTGRGVDGSYRRDYDVRFTGDSTINIFIPKIWAKYKIDALLVLMSGVPESSNQWKEWRDEIVRLSVTYGILSPFSSFSDPGPAPGGGGGGAASVDERETGSAAAAIALRVTPNPVRTSGTISFTLPGIVERGDVVVTIYDLRGRVVTRLFEGRAEAGATLSLDWDRRGPGGELLAAGTYLCEVRIGGERHVITIVVE